MHQVLFIQEILHDIFEHLLLVPRLGESLHSNSDLAALARTCQTLKEPALDLLWEKIFDLTPLARCLPEACKIDGRYYSFRSRTLSEAEWKTLRGYTRRVRSIHHSHRACDDKILLSLAPSTDPLFPNLRSLYWRDLRTLPVAHIAVPSLTSLSLACIRPSKPLPTELFDTIGERCPDIRRFSASFFGSGPLDAAIILRQLCRWTILQYVDCRKVTLSADFILHLPSLSTLKRLWFTLSADLGNHTTHPGSTFVLSNLAELNISSTSLKSITTFFSRIQLPKITDLDVIVLEYTPRFDVRKYWTTVQRACPSNTLARLAFSSIFQKTEHLARLREHGPAYLTLIDLLPYKDFGNLYKIAINVPWTVNLTDADILDLVSTSPHLEQLSINSFWGWKMDSEGGITLDGVVQLLRQCPSLGSVSLVIDIRTFIQIPHGLDASFPPRETHRETLSLNYLDSHLVPEFDPKYRSVFKVFKLWSSFD